jgi:hypothetical protein
MSQNTAEELRRAKNQLLRLVGMGPKPSREAFQIAEMLLDAMSSGFPPESRAARIAMALTGLFASWFGDAQRVDEEFEKRQRSALQGGIEQLFGLVATNTMS